MNNNYWKSCGSYTDINFEKSNEGIAKITINRPEVRNAFRPLTVREMRAALNDAREDTKIGVIILTGEGANLIIFQLSLPTFTSSISRNLKKMHFKKRW